MAGLTLFNNLLYGTTRAGGKEEGGTIFSFDPVSLQQSVVYSFNLFGSATSPGAYPIAPLTVAGSQLIGATSYPPQGVTWVDSLFSFDPASGRVKVDYRFTGAEDGTGPTSGLAPLGRWLLGTTSGNSDATIAGTVFAVHP